jgi:membrane protein involved in colicin uptake
MIKTLLVLSTIILFGITIMGCATKGDLAKVQAQGQQTNLKADQALKTSQEANENAMKASEASNQKADQALKASQEANDAAMKASEAVKAAEERARIAEEKARLAEEKAAAAEAKAEKGNADAVFTASMKK